MSTKGMRISVAGEGLSAIEIDSEIVAAFLCAARDIIKDEELHPSVLVLAMLEAAWLLLQITSPLPFEKRKEMFLGVVEGLYELPPMGERQ